MAINKKLIHFNKLADFESRLAANEILDTSIVFIKDAKKIYTHGNYYATQRTPEEIENIIASSETVQAVIEQISNKVASELDIAIKKEIPTKNSQLENDSNFFVKETSGDGTKFLSDNGTYKTIDMPEMPTMEYCTNDDINNLFNKI